MDIKKKYGLYSKGALVMAIIMMAEAFYPTVSFALTSGPGNTDFSSFEPVSTTSMVNEFNGGFTYNIPVVDIPGANGGGYACGLSYHSGESVESEASWVGYGWSLNPGAINRSKRGTADDSNGDKVIYKNDVPASWTVSAGASVGNLEVYSFRLPVSLSGTLRYNNYRGFGYSAGVGYSKGIVSLGYSVSDGKGSFSVNVNPAGLLERYNRGEDAEKAKAAYKAADGAAAKKQVRDKYLSEANNKAKGSSSLSAIGSVGSAYGMYSFGDNQHATTATPYTGMSVNMAISATINPIFIELGGNFGFNANVSRQKNEPSRELATYGYMYSNAALGDGNSKMDYYSEKESMYTKRDRYLSIPFANADMYSLTGEGVGGGFRLYNSSVGSFFPNEVTSRTPIVQMGTSADIGLTLGLGFSLGVGLQTLKVKRDWDEPGNTNSYLFSPSSADGTFFRFNNDLGGELNYTKSTGAVSAGMDGVNDVPGLKSAKPLVSDDIYMGLTDHTDNGYNRSGRSSYIAYHTNDQMTKEANSKKYYSYQRDSVVESLANRSDVPSGIGELAVNNEDGNQYVYGLPVYSKMERDMQYDVNSSATVNNNFIAYENVDNPKIEVGEIRNSPYATSYLLTEITTPDYTDRTLNGPTDDDFGGYTKFSYSQAYGSSSKASTSTSNWYKWRVPYTGLSYTPNDLTDNTDDVGSVSSGYKEVYYLKQIETKTHIAVFVTNKTDLMLGGIHIKGSDAIRQDGLQAASDASANADPNAKGSGSNNIQKLERIELYAKPVDGLGNCKLIKTTHFEYDYSLCKGVPNNINTIGNNHPSGKLTLKKVWFEYEGVVNAAISPYKFDYTYPTGMGNNGLPGVYASIINYGSNLTTQNPDYDPFNLDRWGSAQRNGGPRHDSLNPWVDQSPAGSNFDPAAWQLKKITLPSGGEILVQYEQNDYQYVQDRRAMAMVSLHPISDLDPLQRTKYGLNNTFYLNVEKDLGITSLAEKRALVNFIKQEFREHKLYFKYLYALVGKDPKLHSCNSDYIKGYVDMYDAGVDSNGLIYIQLGDDNIIDDNSYQLPRHVCIDYVKTEKGGKLKPIGNCNASDGGIKDGNSPVAIAQQLISKIGTTLFPEATCLSLNEALSYLRIPVLHGKKGGGIRVKRILMHDSGIESGDESLYGSEYIYKTVDGETSGVATNEPSEGREENALVTYLPKRNDQSIVNRLIAGKDKDQFEGPIGESLLPSASVGYSRVIVKNIHSGKTNTGFMVNEFFTAKDYPFDKSYATSEVNGSGVDNTGIAQKKDWLKIPAVLVNLSVSNLWLTQGYRFIINEMHGKPKSISTYGGDYDGLGEPDHLLLSSQQVFSYFEPGEKVPMMYDVNNIIPGNPGKEVEVAMERKSVEDVSIDGNIEVDLTVGILIPLFPVYVSAAASMSYSESKLRTHVISKVTRYPAIQKSVTIYQDGIYHTTENIGFSPATGKPTLTKTTDGYNALNLQQSSNHTGTYFSYAIPASGQYKEMGQKAANEGVIVVPGSPGTWSNISITSSLSGTDCYLNFAASSGSVCKAMNVFTRGDLIRINDANYFYHVDEANGSSIRVLPAGLFGTSSIPTGTVTSIEVLKSGRTNELNTIAGSFTTYGAKQNTVTQPIPAAILDSRTAIAAALNTAIASGSSTINYIGGAQMIDGDGNCVTVCQTPDPGEGQFINYCKTPISLSYSSNNFTLSVLKKQGGLPIPIPIDSHPLVADLNRWLDKAWDLDVATLPSFPQSVFNECKSPFAFTFVDSNISVNNNTTLDFQIKNYTTEPNILSKTYDILGVPTTGSNFLSFPRPFLNYTFSLDNKQHRAKRLAYGVTIKSTPGDNKVLKQVGSVRGGGQICGRFDLYAENTKSAYLMNDFSNSTCGVFLYSQDRNVSDAQLFAYIDGSTYTKKMGKFHNDAQGWLWYEGFAIPGSCPASSNPQLKRLALPGTTVEEYCSTTFKRGGQFVVDPTTGDLMYYSADNPCNGQLVSCIQFCPKVNASQNMNVVTATASTFDFKWPFDKSLYPDPATTATCNDYETGVKGKWRTSSSFVYNAAVISGSKQNTTERNYKNAGVFPMTLFNWKNPESNDTTLWVKANSILKYSPNGEAMEEQDAIGIKSAAKYGYKGMLPYLVAQNSAYDASQFESFENVYASNKLEEGVVKAAGQLVDTTKSHSGKSSLQLTSTISFAGTPSTGNFVLKPFSLSNQILSNGLEIKVWVKDPSYAALPINAVLSQLGNPGIAQRVSFVKVAQTGEWTLYSAKASSFVTGLSNVVASISCNALSAIWIDDVRMQPSNAQVMSYVYDRNTFKLLASFDDQHFGMFYQYNAEGKLVRKMVETEKGLKTVQETQYHMPTELR